MPPHLSSVLLAALADDISREVTKLRQRANLAPWRRIKRADDVETRIYSGIMWVITDDKPSVYGRRPWKSKAKASFAPELADVAGPEWVYPGDAEGGIFRDAVAACLRRSTEIIERIDRT